MSHQFTNRLAGNKRDAFEGYECEIFERTRLVARYWHDYRGDDYGVSLADGREIERPLPRMPDFISGGGPQPLARSEAAVRWLTEHLSGRDSGRRPVRPLEADNPFGQRTTVTPIGKDRRVGRYDGEPGAGDPALTTGRNRKTFGIELDGVLFDPRFVSISGDTAIAQ